MMVLLQSTGAVIAFFAHLLLAFLIFKHKKFEQSFTTWMLAALIDFFLFFILKEEKGNFYLPLSYLCGAPVIALVLLFKRKIEWNFWDTIISISVIICLVVWYYTGNKIAIIAYVFASVVSFIPQIKDTAKDPEKTPTRIYLLFFIGDFCSLLGGKDFSVKEILYSFTEATLSLIIILLIFYDTNFRKS